ncbi:MAG: GtrA family protein [Hyphomicrobiaceae bacterium]|nr:GtrA family protein [Hyphomicrobiaceae bacterium]
MNFVTTPGRPAEFLRYTAVSGSSLMLDLAAFWALVSLAVMPTSLAGAVSCMVGLVLHYLLSAGYVFDAAATGKSNERLIGEYALTGAMGFAITASSIFVCVDLIGFPAWFGKGVGVGATFVSVYLVRAGYVFAPRSSHSEKAAAKADG